MTEITWLGVVAIAAGAQLAVLPGEKVQFIIAGLSTRFDPFLVVAAAGTAFAGWTAVEIWLGRTVFRLVPGGVLDALTAAMFLVFAALLIRTAPGPGAEAGAGPGDEGGGPDRMAGVTTDGGELDVRVPLLGWQVPNLLGGFLPIFAMMAFGEFGDKTQLITVTLAAQYAAHPTAIWTGEMLAILPVSLANALVFHRFSHRFDLRRAHLAGAALFTFFAADFLLKVALGVSVWETVVGEATALLPV